MNQITTLTITTVERKPITTDILMKRNPTLTTTMTMMRPTTIMVRIAPIRTITAIVRVDLMTIPITTIIAITSLMLNIQRAR